MWNLLPLLNYKLSVTITEAFVEIESSVDIVDPSALYAVGCQLDIVRRASLRSARLGEGRAVAARIPSVVSLD